MKLSSWNWVGVIALSTLATTSSVPQTMSESSEPSLDKQDNEGSVPEEPITLLSFWDASDESNKRSIDHSKWQKILDSYVVEHESGINRFNFQALKEDPKNHESLIDYVLQLSELDPRTYSKSEQLPYWINLYNALVVYLVFSRYPVESIRDIKLGQASADSLDIKIANVMDQRLSLNDIRNGILRPIWQDNRVHYVLNSASLGCPNISKTAITGENVEELLEVGAKEFVNDSRGVKIQDNQLIISRIYDWYKADFGENVKGVMAHLLNYAEPKLAEQLEPFSEYKTTYDWSVNKP